MDKQDALVAGILAHIPLFEGQPLAALRDHDWSLIAAAVRSFMGSEEVVERALRARYHAAGSFWPDAVSEGMQRVERMIMEKTLEGALSAAIGEDIGGDDGRTRRV